jgi:hypothetical protein
MSQCSPHILRTWSRKLPFDPPGPVIGDWQLGTDTASVFEVTHCA